MTPRPRRRTVVVGQLESALGPARRPPVPNASEALRVAVARAPGDPWPDGLSEEIPEDAEVVAGLDGPPTDPADPLCVYLLSFDAPGRRWLLWAPAEDGEGLHVPAPAARGRATGLSPADAAFHLLEALLRRERSRRGGAPSRPHVTMEGLLGEDLADAMLDRLWPPEPT